MASRRRKFLLTFTALAAVTTLFGSQAWAASGPSAAQSSVPAAVPATGTPQIQDGATEAIAQIGTTMIVGGSFTTVRNSGSTTNITRNRIFSFNKATGTVNTAFAPNFNGEVDALLAGPTSGTVYVAGQFTTLAGATVPTVVLLNLSNGSRVTTFAPGSITRGIVSLALVNGQLIVGGSFSTIGTTARTTLASLNPSTGALTNYVNGISITGHHNYGHVSQAEKDAMQPPPNCTTCTTPEEVQGRTQIARLAVNPQGTRMAVIGNFYTINGVTRDQIAMFNLNGTAATLDTNWASSAYSANCFWFLFDGYMRDVDFSPDGSYFTVAAAGGHEAINPLQAGCDSIYRFETNGSGSDVQPTWRQQSGSDSYYSVANTGTMVLAAGHPRWANNPYGFDGPMPGAVARPSIQGLDPVNGMPLAWNPGREPRAHGIEAVLVASDGIWMGSDTQYWGNEQYSRPRLAFFPLTGGYTPASTATAAASLYLANGTALTKRTLSGTTVGSDQSSTSPLNFSGVRGAVVIGNTLFYGSTSDNRLHSRPFTGAVGGTDTTVNPYSTVWDTVIDNGRTPPPGSPNTYLIGVPPDLYSSSGIGSLTSLAYDRSTGRLYYTLSGKSSLYYRAFSPDSGVLYPIANTVSAPDMTSTTGMSIVGGTIDFVNGGDLKTSSFGSAGFTGSVSTIESARSWAGTFFSYSS